MSGPETFTGTTYQSGVLAYVWVHTLLERRLDWPWLHLVPSAASAEVGGPGDDIRIEFQDAPDVDVQAKCKIDRPRLTEFLQALTAEERTPPRVGLAITRSSTAKIRDELRAGLARLRSGRSDDLDAYTRGFCDTFSVETLQAVYIEPVDVEQPGDPEARHARLLLEPRVGRPEEATAVWDVLCAEAGRIAAGRLRHTKSTLESLLAERSLTLLAAPEIRQVEKELESIKTQLETMESLSALRRAKDLQKRLRAEGNAKLLAKAVQCEGYALLQRDRHDDARAAARRALEYDPESDGALLLEAKALMLGGKTGQARTAIDQLVERSPKNDAAWGIRHLAYEGSPPEPPTVPSGVLDSPKYLLTICDEFIRARDFVRLEATTATLLRLGTREPLTLLNRAIALIELHQDGEAYQADARRLLDEIIEGDLDDYHPLRARALVQRARLLTELNEYDAAQADSDAALDISGDNPNAISVAVRAAGCTGDFDRAADILQSAATSRWAGLLFERALVSLIRGNRRDARRDFDSGIKLLDDPNQPPEYRLRAADVAIRLELYEEAESLLSDVHPDLAGQAVRVAMNLALARGDVDGATALCRDGGATHPPLRARLFGELGTELVAREKYAEAAALFDEVGVERLDVELRSAAAAAYVESDRYDDAQAVLDLLPADQVPPLWALRVTAQIHQYTGAKSSLIEVLERLVEDPSGEVVSARLALGRLLYEVERIEEANEHADHLLGVDLRPDDRIQLGVLLSVLGRDDEAISQAFRAVRSDMNSEANCRTFVQIVMFAKTAPRAVDAVGPDSYVRLLGDDGGIREITVYGEGETDGINTVLVDSASGQLLLHKKVGDIVELGAKAFGFERWQIVEIRPAENQLFLNFANTFAQRFPTADFLVQGFSFDESRIDAFLPMIQFSLARDEQRQMLMAAYRRGPLPLDYIADMMNAPIEQVVAYVRSSVNESGGLVVSHFSVEQEMSYQQAASDGQAPLILTRSALFSAHEFGLLDKLPQCYKLLVPSVLLDELRGRIRIVRDEMERDGGTLEMSQERDRITFAELPRELKAKELEIYENILAFVLDSAEVTPRPLRAPEYPEGYEKAADTLLGSTRAAIELLFTGAGILYIDDLVIRRIVAEHNSASSLTLVNALVQRGVLSERNGAEMTVRLAESAYRFVLPTAPILLQALREAADNTARLDRIFGLLSGPYNPNYIAKVIIDVLEAPVEIGIILERPAILRAAIAGWILGYPNQGANPFAAAQALERVAEERLFPFQLNLLAEIKAELDKLKRRGVNSLAVPGR